MTSPYLTEMERVSFTMLLCQFWELARHAKVPCEQIPLKRINEEIYRSQLPSPLVAWRHKKVRYCPAHGMILTVVLMQVDIQSRTRLIKLVCISMNKLCSSGLGD